MDSPARPPASLQRRKSQVFVDVPFSPLHSSIRTANRGDADSNSSAKENASRIKGDAMDVDSDDPLDSLSPSKRTSALKRKASAVSLVRPAAEGAPVHKQKKSKIVAAADPPPNAGKVAGKPKQTKKAKTSDVNPDEPSKPGNLARCHQCARQFDIDVLASCTHLKPSGTRCAMKYCKACLQNRYQKDIDAIKSRKRATLPEQDDANHVTEVEYYFKCPRCEGDCNCRACRKAQGLEPTGKFVDPKAEGTASVSKPKPAPKPKVKPEKPVAGPSELKKAAAKTVSKPAVKTDEGKAPVKAKPPAPKPKPAPVAKPVPKPTWSRVHTDIDLEAALVRMNIREFVLRFAHIMNIGKGHQEELEDLGVSSTVEDDEGSDALVDWISEAALKAIVLGCLSLLLGDSAATAHTSAMDRAVKQIKASGANLTKMWTALAELRDELSDTLTFCDPLPPPPSASHRTTRSAIHENQDSIFVANTAQFIPVVADLLSAVLETKAIHDDLDRGAVQEKELAKAARELSVKENASYKELKATLTAKAKNADKPAARQSHEDMLEAIEHAQRIAVAECVPRFTPLGRDHQGRVYYALSPGVSEREAALDLLDGGKGEVKLGRRRGVADEESRKVMRHWSWFVAVWGECPKGALFAKPDDDDDEEEEDRDACGWWGFWDPSEVQKLAGWLAAECKLGDVSKRSAKITSEDLTLIPAAPSRSRRASTASSTTGSVALSACIDDDELSELSDDEDEAAQEGMCFDEQGNPVPTKHDLRTLVAGLNDYGKLLAWRVRRASADGKKGEAIPAKSFYGK